MQNQFTLTIIAGPQRGQSFKLEAGSQTLGRVAGNQIVLVDEAISKQHAKITVRPDHSLTLEDLGSSNGTFVNGQRIHAPTLLQPGDMIQFGLAVQARVDPPTAAGSVDDLAPTRLEPSPPAPKAGGSPYRLVLRQGPQPGQTFVLTEGVQTIGRAPDNQLHLSDPTLSKQHARLIVQPNGLFIQDLNSSNGTFVNGQRLINSVQLNGGDMVQVGTAVILEVVGPGGVMAARPVAAGPPATARSGPPIGLIAAGVVVLLLGLGLGVGGWLVMSGSLAGQATPTAAVTPTGTPPPAVAMTFKADKSTVKLGECATLKWQVEHAQEVRLDGESVPEVGQRKVCPQEASKIYRLTALALTGKTTEQTVELTVPPTPAPPAGVEIEFSAEATSVLYGDCVNLKWAVTNAQAVLLEGQKVGPSGKQSVCPTEPVTTYTLVVQPLEGQLVEQTVILNVPSTPTPTATTTPMPTATSTSTPAPSATPLPQAVVPVIDQFLADQYALNPGSCTVLRWTVRRATTVRLDGATTANQGDMRVCPNASTNIYTLVATGSGGSVQASVTLGVNAPTPTPVIIYQPPPVVLPPVAPPSGPPSVDAWVTMRGDCVYYGWNVNNVKEVYFDGKGVTGQGQKKDWCFGDDDDDVENPTLRIIHRDGRVEEIFISDAPGSPYWR